MDLEVFRADVRDALAARLAPRSDERAFSFLGAGQDDLEAGRAFLAALADGGWAVPAWPVEHGGLGATPDQARGIAEELRRVDVPHLYPYLLGLALGGPTVATPRSTEPQAPWLPRLPHGEGDLCPLVPG